MSEEKRRILEMLEAGKITQEDAQRLLDALGEESMPLPPETPPVPAAPSWSGEEGPREKGRPSGNVEIHVEGEGMGAFVQGISRALDQAGPALEKLGEKVDQMMSKAGAYIDAVSVGEGPDSFGSNDHPTEEYSYQQPVMDGPITQLRVDWVNGPVAVRLWEGDVVRIAEYADRPLDEGETMEVSYQEGALVIRWTKESGRPRRKLRKRLVLELPRATRLDQGRVSCISGRVEVAGLSGGHFHVETVSGPLMCRALRWEELRVKTASGAVKLEEVSANFLRVAGISGKVAVDGCAVEELRAETVSGSLAVTGNGERLRLSTVSGALSLELGQYPKQVRASTVSGGLELRLPEEGPGFTAEYSTVSGRLSSQFPLRGDLGKRKGLAVYGEGGAQLRLNTTSGGINLAKTGT